MYKIGYGKLVVAAFLFHVLSAVITFGAGAGQSQTTAYLFLYIGTFVFALANGTLEAVANPLVSTLFPNNRTHYLNILHASWPAGLVLGGLVGWILGDGMHVGWKVQLGLFLVPTVLYGIAFFGQSFPKSEASAKGLSVGQMLRSRDSRRARGVSLVGLFFKDQLGAFSRSSPEIRSTSPTGAISLGRRLAVAGCWRQNQLLRRIDPPVRALHDSRPPRFSRWAPIGGFRTSPATS